MRLGYLLLALAAPCATASASFTVTGDFRYVDRAFTFSGFSGAEPQLPIRHAQVQVVNNATSQVLATGATNALGHVSLFVPGAGTADIVVRCQSRSDPFGASLRVTNSSNVQYSVSSNVFAGWNLGSDLNVGTVVAQKILSGSSQANPFNMLDQMVAGIEYVLAQGAPNPSASLRMIWPASGSFASGTTASIDTDDGYDDLVQLHEFGHVIHNHYSDNDELGGSHGFGDSDQDPRLSFGEGWASFFAGAVRQHQGIFDPGFYLDCSGQGQNGIGSVQLRMRFENGTPFGNSTSGEANEGAVFCVLWDVVDTAQTNDGGTADDDALDGSIAFNGGLSGDEAQWLVFVGPVKSAANLTIRDAWNGFFAPVNHGNHPPLEAIFDTWDMRFFGDALEPNGSTPAPYTLTTAWGPIRTLYFSAASPPVPGDGDVDNYSIVLTKGTTIELETRYPNGASDADTYCDPRLELFRPNGLPFATDEDGGTGRNALLTNQIADVTGAWTARVRTVHSYRRTGSYQFRARLLSGPPGGCLNPSADIQFGVGKAGVNGTPQLIAVDDPVIPSPLFRLRATNAPASFPGVLLLGVTPLDVAFDGGRLYVDPLLFISIVSNATGTVDLAAPLQNPNWCGITVHLQAMFPGDPGASDFLQTSQSNRLTLTFGG